MNAKKPPTPMNDTQPTGLDLDEILNKLHDYAAEKGTRPWRTGDSYSIAEAKQALTRWGLEQRVDENRIMWDLPKNKGLIYFEEHIQKRFKKLDAELQANLQDGGE